MKQKIKKRNEKREQRCFHPLLSNFLLIPNFAYFKTNQDSRKGVLFKLKQNGINGVLLNFIKDFTLFWKDRVVINSHYSTWSQCRHQSRLHPWVNNLHKQIVRGSFLKMSLVTIRLFRIKFTMLTLFVPRVRRSVHPYGKLPGV